jgi:hypothetical protein
MAIDPEVLAASLRRLATLGEPGTGVVEALRHVTRAAASCWLMSRMSPHPTGPAACLK